MKKIIAVAVCLFAGCTALNVSAADDVLVRKLIAASGFQNALKQEFREQANQMKGLDVEKFIALFDFKKAEDLYAKSVARGMSNEEVQTLITAYQLPGYQSAVRKQTMASSSVIGFVIKETTRVMPLLGGE